jgi:hypothetical protein
MMEKRSHGKKVSEKMPWQEGIKKNAIASSKKPIWTGMLKTSRCIKS